MSDFPETEFIAPDAHAEFQYESAAHHKDTSLAGLWLFLATETLFFGVLIFLWIVYHHYYPQGFALAADKTVFEIGSANTGILVCSSFTYSVGLVYAERGNNRRLFLFCIATIVLGTMFLALKFYEWTVDWAGAMWPGSGFGILGPQSGGAQLFWVFYWVATILHGFHMSVGIFLVSWIARRAWRGDFSPTYTTPVEVVGLYWSFVDMVWMVLYPTIYLVARP